MGKGVWLNSREISERIVVEGKLVMETPACFISGETAAHADLALLLDPVDGSAFLPGSSLAGALRTYLRSREVGYRTKNRPDSLENLLFGKQVDDEGEQSWLVVSDAFSENPQTELRDGVAINPVDRTAVEKMKYDIELLEAGAAFDLRFELLVNRENKEKLLAAFMMALEGLEQGEIPLGARKRRGYGRCRVVEWQVRRFDLQTATGLLAWLADEPHNQRQGSRLAELLEITDAGIDERCYFSIELDCQVDSPILIRSASGQPKSADSMHLHSKRPDFAQAVPVISGTSLGGVIRSQALRIVNTLDIQDGHSYIDNLFGAEISAGSSQPKAGRIWIDECVVETARPLGEEARLIQNRVKLDRFTGGAYHTALFNEQPFFAPPDGAIVRLKIRLHNPQEAEIGLLLLVMKDIWTGDLPVGGESSVGRGRLSGIRAIICHHTATQSCAWQLNQVDGKLQVKQTGGEPRSLQSFVDRLGGDEA